MGGKVPAAMQAAAGATENAGKQFAGLPGAAGGATATLADLVKAANETVERVPGRVRFSDRHGTGDRRRGERGEEAQRRAAGERRALDVNTEFGRQHLTLMANLAAQTNTYSASLANNNASAGQVAKSYERGRSAYISTAVAMGRTREAAARLADQAIQIPNEIRTQFVFSGADISAKQAANLNAKLKGLAEGCPGADRHDREHAGRR